MNLFYLSEELETHGSVGTNPTLSAIARLLAFRAVSAAAASVCGSAQWPLVAIAY